MSVYTISRYTSPTRGVVRHADDGTGKPACMQANDKRRRLCWETDDSDVTCKRCIKVAADCRGKVDERE